MMRSTREHDPSRWALRHGDAFALPRERAGRTREHDPSRWALRQVALPPHHSAVLAAGSRAVTIIRMVSPVAMPSRGDRPGFLAGFFVRARRGFFTSIQLSQAFRITRAAFSS